MNPKTYIPVLSPDGTSLMPMEHRRAQAKVNRGEAQWVSNDLNIKAVQLLVEPSGYATQPISLGLDPGKLFSGIGLVSTRQTLFKAHLILPFPHVRKKMEARRILRRARRGRRINRKVAFSLRSHRQKRFNNRRQRKIPPSILANRQLELRVVRELLRLFPVTQIVYERVRADVDRTSGRKGAKSGKGFSAVMVGQKWMVAELSKLCPTRTVEGWQADGNGTSQIRTAIGLVKDKANKAAQTSASHAVDGIALAASSFIRYKAFHTATTQGHQWIGSIRLTPAPFRVIARPNLYRRQLHFENPVADAPNHRKRKGGTVTPFGFRSGDYVRGEKAGMVVRGWVGGYSNTEKTKNVSLYDHNWHRIGQFSPSKVHLIKRSSRLCVA